MDESPRYWFPAKRRGWGWGLPKTWEGWLVLLGYLLLAGAGTVLIDAQRHAGLLTAYLAAISVLLLAICWRKGEPPRWRRNVRGR